MCNVNTAAHMRTLISKIVSYEENMVVKEGGQGGVQEQGAGRQGYVVRCLNAIDEPCYTRGCWKSRSLASMPELLCGLPQAPS
jgi:hypothetical protein